MQFAPHATSKKNRVIENIAIPSENVEDVMWELTWIYDAYFFKFIGAVQPAIKAMANVWIYWFGI